MTMEIQVDSDDALSSIAAVTRQTRMGLGETTTSLAGSDRPLRNAFDSSSSSMGGYEGAPSVKSLFEEPLLRSDTMPIKLDETEEYEVVPSLAAEER